MPILTLMALIAQIVLGLPDFLDLIKSLLGMIDGLEGASQRRVARKRMGEILKAHKEGATCSVKCREALEGLAAELAAVKAATL
jgi:hypothetical protein